MAESVRPIPEGYQTVTPYLVVEDAEGLIAFIQRAFGGTLRSRHDDPQGRVAHAEVEIGDSRVMLGQSNDQWPPTRAMLHLYVEEVDAVFRRAVEAGGRSVREPETMFYGDRSGGVEDASGNQWWISTHVEDVSAEEMARRQVEQAEKAEQVKQG
jgi:PhnB protein